MDPAVMGALIGFGGTALGTLGSQYLSLRREAQRERHERAREAAQAREAEAEALRSLLDFAAWALRDALNAMDRVAMLIAPVASGGKMESPPLRFVEDLQDKVNEADGAESKLAVRLPSEHPALTHYSAAADVLERAVKDIYRWGQDQLDAGQLIARLNEYRKNIGESEAGFREASRAFHSMEPSPPESVETPQRVPE